MELARTQEIQAPNIYSYHDCKVFLRDWFEHLKGLDPEFSLRRLSREAGFSSNGYLSRIMEGPRTLTAKALFKIAPFLNLSDTELSYLELLRSVSESKSEKDKESALKRLQNFGGFHEVDTTETEVFQYLTKWHYVAIREMAILKDFEWDAFWIQKRLHNEVKYQDICEAMKFLESNGYVKVNEDGSAEVQAKTVKAHGGTYRIALAQYYSEVFELAKKSFTNTLRDNRKIRGYTVVATKREFKEIKKVIDRAISEIEDLYQKRERKDGDVENVYQLAFCGFPLSKDPQDGESD